MRWLILILILSCLFLSGCYTKSFENQPVLEKYIILRAENTNNLTNLNLKEAEIKNINQE